MVWEIPASCTHSRTRKSEVRNIEPRFLPSILQILLSQTQIQDTLRTTLSSCTIWWKIGIVVCIMVSPSLNPTPIEDNSLLISKHQASMDYGSLNVLGTEDRPGLRPGLPIPLLSFVNSLPKPLLFFFSIF